VGGETQQAVGGAATWPQSSLNCWLEYLLGSKSHINPEV